MQSRKSYSFEGMANAYEVGDVISFELTDGEPVKAMAVKETGDGMIFVFVDSLRECRRMYERGHEIHDYERSDLRQWLVTELINRFPDEIRIHMVPHENGDLLRLPSEKEIFGENTYAQIPEPDVEQWEPMKERRNRVAFQGIEGDWQYWWLRDVVSSAHFAYVTAYGNAPSQRVERFWLSPGFHSQSTDSGIKYRDLKSPGLAPGIKILKERK